MRWRSSAHFFNTRRAVVDVFSPSRRSEIMAKIKGRENRSTELRLIHILREFKIRGWRRRAAIFGSPDFVFPKARMAVFVDGCFWHGCPLHGSLPASNRFFWMRKLDRNRERDRLVGQELKKAGWVVLRIWQHELKKPKLVASRVSRSLARSSIKLEDVSKRAQQTVPQAYTARISRKQPRA
jgi:DNA mismatch endonuclease, patch repair protein